MSGISAQVLDLAPKDAEVIPGVHVPGFTGQGWSTHETMLVVRWLFAHPDAWDQAMKVARDPGSNPHTVADTLHEQIVPQAELDAIAAQGFDPAKANWLEIAHELIERRDDPKPAAVPLAAQAGISGQVEMASTAAHEKAHATASATARRTASEHPRDDRGRWARAPGGEEGFHGRAATAGSGIQERAESYIAGMRGKVKPRELDNYSVGTYKRETLNPAYHYTPAQTEAIRKYTDHSFEMNADLRGDELERRDFQKAKLTEEADQISAAMQPLPDDLVLLRELNGAHRMDGLKAGDVIADDAFASTTLTSGSGRYAANRSDTTVMHILAPKGTPSVWVGAAAGTFPEDETILDRGQPMIVMKSPALSPGRSNVTDVYLLALPKQVAS